MAAQIARFHHERWDGTGYPYGAKGTNIPSSARLVALADVYDALTHDRVYRPAMDEQRALSIIASEREKQFDPHLLDVFFDVLPSLRNVAAAYPDHNRSAHENTLHHEIQNSPAVMMAAMEA